LLTDEFIMTVFRTVLGDEVQVDAVDLDTYVTHAMDNQFIRMQIEVGIYDEENIYNEFLSPAVAYAEEMCVAVCPELIRRIMADVDDSYAALWVLNMAVHEAGHIKAGHAPETVLETLENELALHEHGSDLEVAVHLVSSYAEEQSGVFSRVMERVKNLER
jgi:hypothetical protein